MRILDRYILTEWSKVFALCLLSFGGLLMLSVSYNWVPDFLSWGSTVWTILCYLGLYLSTSLSLIIPISLLVSVVFVLANLNRNQELAAARAAGLSIRRITTPLWGVGLALALLLAVLNAFFVPDALEAQRNIIEREQFAAIRAKGGSALPSGQGQAEFVSFENSRERRLWLMTRLGLLTGQAFEVVVHAFDAQGREVRSISARFAEFRKVGGRWQWKFREGRDMRFNPVTGQLDAQPRFTELVVPEFDDDPEVMLYATRDPELLSLREVSRLVEQTGSSTSGRNAAFAMRYHSILSAPVICLVVIAVAIPFSVGGGRISPMVGVAKTFGLFLAFYFLTMVSSAFGVSGGLPPVIAAWLPAALTALWIVPKLKSVN